MCEWHKDENYSVFLMESNWEKGPMQPLWSTTNPAYSRPAAPNFEPQSWEDKHNLARINRLGIRVMG